LYKIEPFLCAAERCPRDADLKKHRKKPSPANARKHTSQIANEGKKYINRLSGRSANPRQTRVGISKQKQKKGKERQI